jgi:outer membrane autotransporter protein
MSFRNVSRPSKHASAAKRSEVIGRDRRQFSPSVLVLALSAALAAPGSAFALDWAGTVDRSWNNAANWTNPAGAVPTAADAVNIQNDTTIGPVFTQNGTTNASGALTLGAAGGASGSFVLGVGSTLTSASAIIQGNVGGALGGMSLSGVGSTWTITNGLIVNGLGNHLTILAGATVTNAVGAVGAAAGSNASVFVNGTGGASTWNNNSLTVGGSGTGTVNITNGGTVNSGGAIIGNSAGGNGTVNVDGGTFGGVGILTVGSSGSGTLNITNGGKVTKGDTSIGELGTGQGTVLVDGVGSTMDVNFLTVGENSTKANLLTVSNGGTLTATSGGTIGLFAGSKGTAVVDGGTWTNTNTLGIAELGKGDLTIQNGGVVNSSDNGVAGANAGVIGVQANSTGNVTVNGAGSTWNNTGILTVGLGGSGTLIVQNGGSVTATSIEIQKNAGSTGNVFIGGQNVAAAPGTLNASPVQINANGHLTFRHTDVSGNYNFDSVISGGGIILADTGLTSLIKDSSGFTGDTSISGGRFAVDGKLGGNSLVLGNGVFGGTGTVKNLQANLGGTIAPGGVLGNTMGTLTVTGNLGFAGASVYQVKVNATGQSDKLVVAGTADIAGGSVQVAAGTGAYAANTAYTILTAGTLTGTFTGVSVLGGAAFAFLTPTLSYANPNEVDLVLTLNGVPMGSVGGNPGQSGLGNGIQGLGAGNPIYDAYIVLPTSQAPDALRQLVGETHSTLKSALLQGSHFTSDAALERLRGMDSPDMAPTSSVAVGADTGKSAGEMPAFSDISYWAKAQGSWGKLKGDNNVASATSDEAGFMFGGDTGIGEAGRIGLMGGYSRSTLNVGDRSSSASSDNYHVGLYGGSRWGDLALRSGLSYSWHDISTSRNVNFPGFSDQLAADYKANTTQAFAELGYRIKTEQADLEPYANIAHASLRTDGFTERGGPAALTGNGATQDVTFATLGLRAARKFSLTGGGSVTARGALGWRTASGDTTSTTHMSLVSPAGAAQGDITGAPIMRNAAVIEAGLDFRLSPTATLGLTYGGQFGSGSNEQSARVNLNVAF